MSDALDKFVLQYTVDLQDSIKRLEQLNTRVEKVSKESGKTAKQFKEFANGAADEIGKIVPGVDKATAAVRMLGAEFAVASVAIGALGAGIKVVLDLRNQYNQQRSQGREVGVSGLRIEEYQRKFVKAGGGYLNRDNIAEQVGKFNSDIAEAYADPTRNGAAAKRMRMLGLDPGKIGGKRLGTNEGLGQLATRLQSMSDEQVSGLAQSFGYNPDFLKTLKKIGPGVSSVTEHSEKDISDRQQAEKNVEKLNDAIAQMNEKFKEAENVLAQHLIPGFTKLVELFGKIADSLPGVAKKIADDAKVGTGSNGKKWGEGLTFIDMIRNFGKRPGDYDQKSWGQRMMSQAGLGGLGDLFSFQPKGAKPRFDFDAKEGKSAGGAVETAKQAADKENLAQQRLIAKDQWRAAENQTRAGNKQNSVVDKLLADADKQYEQGRADADAMTQAINLFASSVATFANAIDERQAWAAWAGEVGHAAGLSSGQPGAAALPNSVNDTYDPTAPTKYDAEFQKAAKATGVPMDLLKRVANIESKFNPNAKSEAGAIGLMQIIPSNFKSLGITDPRDPSQNIMGGAKLLKEYLGKAGSVREALMMYHGGYDRSGWGPRTMAYPGLVLGDANFPTQAGIKGESRNKMQLRAVQATTAARLGVPLNQLQLGDVNKGDVAWANSQLKAGIANNIQQLNVAALNPALPQQTRARIMSEARQQASGYDQMVKYGDRTESNQQQGDRVITLGERAIVINVNGADNPRLTAEEVFGHIDDHINDLANAGPDGVKR